MDRTPQPEIDHATIVPVVRRLYGRPVEIVAWQVTPIGEQSLGLSAGLFRVTGSSEDGSAWSVVLKILRPVAPEFLARFAETDRDRLEEAYLWDREARLYESGLLDALPDGFSAAACLGSRRTGGTCWLWFEDLGANSGRWDVSRYALAARHLGRFNGAFLGPRSRPDEAWLCHDWVRTWVLHGLGSLQHDVVENEAVWQHDLVRNAFAPDARARLRRVWERRREVLDRLDALPQTFCHTDAFRPNLFDRVRAGTHETVGIDWSYAGLAPIATDLGHLVMGSVAFADHTQDVRSLTAAALPEYVAGLRDAGWGGREADVHAGFALSALRWLFMLGMLNGVLDPKRQERLVRFAGQPYPDIVARAGDRTGFLLDLIENGVST